MIERNFKKFLQKIASEELSSNLLAQVVAIYYDKVKNIEDKKKFFEGIEGYYKTHIGFKNLPKFDLPKGTEIIDNNDKDFRLKRVRLSNIRGYPNGKEYEGKTIPFGIDFQTNEEELCNAFLLGANGSGKTSLFSAIEYLFTGEISELKTRSAHKNERSEIEDYLSNFNNYFNKSFLELSTKSGIFDLSNNICSKLDITKTNPHTHFISEFDVSENSKLKFDDTITKSNQNDPTFHFLIAESLGLKEYLDFKKLLFSLINYNRITETKKIKELNIEYGLKNRNINEFKQRIINNKKEIDELNNRSKDEQIKSVSKVLEENKNIINDRLQINFDIKLDSEKFIKSIEDYLTEQAKLESYIIDDIDVKEVQFLSAGLELILKTDNCPFCLDSKKPVSIIKEEVNNRIYSAKEFRDQNEKVSEIFRYVSSAISYIYGLDFKISSIINGDFEELGKFEQFISLLDEEKKIKEDKENLYDVNIYDKSRVFWDKSGYDPEEQEKFSRFLIDYGTYYIDYINRIIDPIKEIDKIRTSILSQILKSYFSNNNIELYDNIGVLKKENERLDAEIKNLESDIDRIESEKEILELSKDIFTKIVNDSKPYYNAISKIINNIVTSNIEPIKGTIQEIMEDYFNDLEVKDSKIKLIIETNENDFICSSLEYTNKNTKKAETISPKKYFNSFRYKLFCLMISFSIAIASRRNSGINLPIIFDDVFYSSDYRNRKSIKEFIKKIFSVFNKYSNLPLQFILFSHDEVIFNVARDVISELDFEQEDLKNIGNKTIFSKLYPPNDLEKQPKGDGDNKYWDLTYRIPNNLSVTKTNSEKIAS